MMSSATVQRPGSVAEGACLPGRGCSVQAWLVTAPQQRPRPFSRERAPWGTYHLKENGGILTACGECAVTWHVFWGHPVTPLAPQACPTCFRVVRESGGDIRGSRGGDRHVHHGSY